MSSTRRMEIFIVILTIGLGTLVHFGKSRMFSASFVELKAEREKIFFFFLSKKGKNDCILHNVLLAKGMQGMALEKKKQNDYIVIFIFLKFEIRNKSYFRIRTIKFKKWMNV